MQSVTPRQLMQLLPYDLKAGLVPYLEGEPGIGKSAVVNAMAKQFNLKVIDLRLGQAEPTDLLGMPDTSGEFARYKPFEEFPLEGREIPDGYSGWLIFLDELPAAKKDTQAAAYKLIYDRMVGQAHLHPNVVIIAAGNASNHRAYTNPILTPLQSRLIHYQVEFNPREFLEDVVYPQKWDVRVAAYMEWKPHNILDFRPDHENKTFCCPRTWDFVQRRLQALEGAPLEDWMAPSYMGTISPMIANEFLVFTKVFNRIPSRQSILSDPRMTPVPHEQELKLAILTVLTESIVEDELEAATTYVSRMPGMEFWTVFLRSLMGRAPELRHNTHVTDMMARIARGH